LENDTKKTEIMECQQSETIGNTFGGNNYSDQYTNTMNMDVDQRYENGQINNTTGINNITNMFGQQNMNDGPGLGMMAELL